MTEILRIHNLHKVFPGKRRRDRPVVAIGDVDLDVSAGEFISIVGPSGCGKSTLLYIIGGFLKSSSGVVEFNGAPITGPAPARGIVFQAYGLFPWKTVLGNVEAGVATRGLPRAARRQEARRFLDIVGLSDVERLYPSALSGGMQQRVAIARTLAQDPELLLMDEPFGALDAQTRAQLQTELLDIWELSHKTVVFVTHSVEEAIFLSDRVIVLGHRPSIVREVIHIPVPRPRLRETVLEHPEYPALNRRVWDLLEAPAC